MKLLLVVFALMYVALADQCLPFAPNLADGKNCGGGVSCQFGSFCDQTGKCSPLVAVGGACVTTFSDNSNVNMCEFGSICKGPKGSQICVAYANPGESCNSSTVSLTPSCGPNLVCNFTSNVCGGGSFGDKCGSFVDCAGFANCTNSACAALPDGAFCGGSIPCGLNSYCKSGVCSPYLTLGVQCNLNSVGCAPGTYCIGKSSLDTPVCVANQTRNPGEYCGTISALCIGSSFCANSYCAKTAPDTCSTGEPSCTAGQVCNCGSLAGYAGVGNCVNDPCGKLKTAADNCLSASCGYTTSSGQFYSQMQYTQSCGFMNCGVLGALYLVCSPASTLQVSFALTFLTLIVSFLGKKF